MKHVLLVIFIAIESIVSANNYYVSPFGRNTNPGTFKEPWLTISYAESIMENGNVDTIFIRGGTYNEKLRIYGVIGKSALNPGVFMAYGNEEVIIDGTGLEVNSGGGLVFSSCAYIKFINLNVANINLGSEIYSVAGILLSGEADYNDVINCKVFNSWGQGISVGGDYCVIDGCEVYDVCENNNREEGRTAGQWGYGISARRSPVGAIIRNCIVHDCWGEGISTYEATYTTIEDNIIFDVYSAMLYVSDATDCLVQRNLIYQTKVIGINSGICLADETHRPSSARNIVINNIVYGCYRNFRSGNNTPLLSCVIANNNFVNSRSGTAPYNVQIGNTTHASSTFANNIVIQEDNIPCIYAVNVAGLTFARNLYNKSYDSDAFGAGDIIGDPKFNGILFSGEGSLSKDNFKLLNTSPAINKGVIISKVVEDIFLNPRDLYPDIGAHEYNSENLALPVAGILITGAGGLATITTENGTLQLNASISPANAANKAVTWSLTSGTGQATINSTGLVTALANGTVTARATANDGSGIYGTFVITISNQVNLVPVTGITVTGGLTTITTVNGTLQLIASVSPANSTNKAVTWSLTNGTGQATINSIGLVTALANGTVTARATANDGSGVYGTFVITISNQFSIVPVMWITVTGSGGLATITTENGTLQLSVSISPANATNKTVIWSISNGTGRATISSTGFVTAIASGTVIAKAKATDGSGVLGSLVININAPPEIVIEYQSAIFSGFVSEIDASGSYDSDHDKLMFTWSVPSNVSVSSRTGNSIKYLSPPVNNTQTINFTLEISDGKTSKSLVFPVKILPFKPELEVAEISNVEASNFQSPHYPYNVVDGNIGTMWSSLGNDQWLLIELLNTFEVHHVKLAFNPTQHKEAYFDILGSKDKKHWDPILTKVASCSFSGGLQTFEFPLSKAETEFKYLMIVAKGSLEDSWNYISELKIFGYRPLNSPQFENLPIKIYPNPVKDHITIKIDERSIKPDFIKFFDFAGVVVFGTKIDQGSNELTIPINLKVGIYILEFKLGRNTLFTQKMIVTK